MSITSDNKKIAAQLASAFGGKPTVREFLHENSDLKIDLIYCMDQSDEKLFSIGTIGLSDYPLQKNGKNFPTRLEICAVTTTQYPLFLNLLATAAFNMIRSKNIVVPGSVMRGYVSEYYPEIKLPHLYFTAPFIWENILKTTFFETKKVSWLLCFPISSAEANFIEENGDDSFEDLLQEASINIFDLNRKSVV
jgi:antitoxin YqcF